MVARSKADLLEKHWADVKDGVKDLIWQDIMETFDVPNDEVLKTKWISYVGVCWRGFKAELTRKYIYGSGDSDGMQPWELYSYISEELWKKFVKSREEPEFQEKRKKAQKSQEHNKCPHRLSRGGYKKLKKKMKEEKMKEMQEELGDSSVFIECPPSPPRHEVWKRARIRETGDYTSEETSQVVERIETLMEQSTQGTFVANGREDILTTAIGKPEHPGRVRTAPWGVGIRQFFGSSSRQGSTQGGITIEMFQAMQEQLQKSINETVEKVVSERMTSLEYSQKNTCDQPPPNPAVVSKVSCSVAQSIENRGVRDVSPKPQLSCGQKMLLMAHQMQEAIKLPLIHDIDNKNGFFFIDSSELVNFSVGRNWAPMTVLQLWCTLLQRFCMERGNIALYGFIDPYMISKSSSRPLEKAQITIQNKMHKEDKVCYLAPVLQSNHFQLAIICPKTKSTVWLCSLKRKPDEDIMGKIDRGIIGYWKLKGERKYKNTWIYPKAPQQKGGWECGYYVMRFMWTIVSNNIIDSWENVFCDESSYSMDDIKECRERFATFFLEYYEELKSRKLF